MFGLRGFLLGWGLIDRRGEGDGGEGVYDLDESIFETNLCDFDEVSSLDDGKTVGYFYFLCVFLGSLHL